jgi:hypothetical protein
LALEPATLAHIESRIRELNGRELSCSDTDVATEKQWDKESKMNRASKVKNLEVIHDVGGMTRPSCWCDAEWVKVPDGSMIQITPHQTRLRIGQKCPILP